MVLRTLCGRQPLIRRTFATIAQKHCQFLDLVASHGDGDISLSTIQPPAGAGYNGTVMEILLNNPEKRNAISGRMMGRLAEVVDHLALSSDFKQDGDLVAVVIRGAGNEAFSAGADFSLAQNVLTTPERGLLMSHFMTEALNTIRSLPLISVCCINGTAIGGGAELSTVGDFRMMEASHHVQFVHARLGASPGWGGARRLTEIVGRRHAMALMLASQKVTAEKGLEIGYVDNVVQSAKPLTDEDWHERTLQFLSPYLTQPYPKSIRGIKAAIAGADTLSVADAIALEQAVFESRWFSADNQQALAKAADRAHKHHREQVKLAEEVPFSKKP